MIPQEFSTMNLPSIIKWAADKMQYSATQADKDVSYASEKWFFTGMIDRRRDLSNFYEMSIIDGIEYHAIMNIDRPKYAGQKTRFTISLIKAKSSN